MQLLNNFELNQISGGVHCQQMAQDIGPFVFYSTGIGSLLSLFYALGTAEVRTYAVQNKMISSFSVVPTFLSGVGMFALGGLAFGAINHLYHFEHHAPKEKETA